MVKRKGSKRSSKRHVGKYQRRRIRKRNCKRGTKNKDKKFCLALQRLKKLNPAHRKQAISMSNDSFIRKMCSNIRKLRYKKLSGSKLKVIKRHRNTLRKLADNNLSISSKRKMLSQSGGIFPILPILAAATSIAPAVAGLFKK